MIPPIPQRERTAVFRLFLYSMVLAASYTLARTVGDSLFLSRIGSENLAVVFVISGLTTAFVASGWYALTRKLPLGVVVKISSLTFAFLTLVAWWALPYLHHSLWLLGAIYLLTEIKGCVNAINIITAMNDVLGSHSSRHAWARIGLGVPLAGIVAGSLVGIEGSYVELRTWLLVAAILDLLAAAPLLRLSKLRLDNSASASTGRRLSGRLARFAAKMKVYACSQQFRFWIAILIAAKVIVLTLVTFEWKVSVNRFFQGNEAVLAQFFGTFYAGAGIATLLVQAFVTGRLLNRRSIYVPILVMPVSFILLNALFIAGSGALFLLVVTTLAKSLEVWRRSVHDTTLNFLYTKIERSKRRSTIALNSAVVKPLAEVFASLILLVGSVYWHKSLILFATVTWILAAVALLRLIAVQGRRVRREKRLDSGIKQLASGLLDNH